MGKRIAFLLTLALVHPTVETASAQATIEVVIPEDARISVQRLGTDREVPAVVGMELLPGDGLVAAIEDTFLELSCLMGENTDTYRLKAPFRVRVDVPTESACHMNVLLGESNVLAESPTETTVGGVTLSSVGTQYAVEVRRTPYGAEHQVTVFDGLLSGVSPAARGIEVTAGRTAVQRSGSTEWSTRANSAAELERSATLYARFDLEAARRNSVTIADSVVALRGLKTLHYDVLSNPSDTVKRVELARRQAQYKISDQALYNLKRVNVTSTAKLQRYRIDPAVLKSNLRPTNRARLDAAISRDTAASSAAVLRRGVADRVVRDTRATGTRARSMVDSLQRVIRGGRATSREYFELAKSYLTLGDPVNARSAGTRALNLVARDRRMTDAEIAELKALLERIR